jgi:arylsulfatase A
MSRRNFIKSAGQLYNLKEDLAESRNLWNEHPEIVERLTNLLEKYKQQGYSRPLTGKGL